MNSGSSYGLISRVCLHSYTLSEGHSSFGGPRVPRFLVRKARHRFFAASRTLRGAQLRFIGSDCKLSRLIQTVGSEYHFSSAQ